MQFIRGELGNIWQLLSKNFVPISIICFSTILIVVFKETKTPILPKPHIDGIGDWALGRFVYWGLVPLFFGVLITRKSPLKLGLGLGDYKYWVPVSLIFLGVVLPFVYAASSMSGFEQYYTKKNFDFGQYFLETLLVMLGWEFFFRGFMTLGLKDSLKEAAILVQMIPFTLLHLGKPLVESVACVPAGLFWGYVCYRSNSYWPALIMHLAVNIVLKCGSIGYF